MREPFFRALWRPGRSGRVAVQTVKNFDPYVDLIHPEDEEPGDTMEATA